MPRIPDLSTKTSCGSMFRYFKRCHEITVNTGISTGAEILNRTAEYSSPATGSPRYIAFFNSFPEWWRWAFRNCQPIFADPTRILKYCHDQMLGSVRCVTLFARCRL